MGVVFQDGDPVSFPKIPANFPKCGSWSYEGDELDSDDEPHDRKERKNGAHPPQKGRKGTK